MAGVVAGKTYIEIGQELGLSGTRCRQLIVRHLKHFGLSIPCPGHVLTIRRTTKWGDVYEETGQYVNVQPDGTATIYDPVEDTTFTGTLIEIIERDGEEYWKEGMILHV